MPDIVTRHSAGFPELEPGGGEHMRAAAEVADAGMPTAEPARVLAGRFGRSRRRARHLTDQAAASGRLAVPGPAAVFTVTLRGQLNGRLGAEQALRPNAKRGGEIFEVGSVSGRPCTGAATRSWKSTTYPPAPSGPAPCSPSSPRIPEPTTSSTPAPTSPRPPRPASSSRSATTGSPSPAN